MKRLVPALCLGGFAAVSVLASFAYAQPPARGAQPAGAPAGRLSAADAAELEEQFTREIWPLLERAKGGCLSCHGADSTSQLKFAADGAGANFRKLLGHGFFDPDNPTSLLARITSPVAEQRMPPPPEREWSDGEVNTLRLYVKKLYDRGHASGARADEEFPAELRDPYTGKPVQAGPDNTFLTYRQLKGKIRTLFGDDWHRGGKDLFQANIAQFNGADFKERFDESSKASATFLSALDGLARDVASRAYLNGTGPFAGRAENLPSPLSLKAPDAAYRTEIDRLYRKLLFRGPTETERQQAWSFIRSIYREHETIAREPGDLDLELVVEDDQGQRATRPFRIPYTHQAQGIYQEWLDQSPASPAAEVRKKLDRVFTFRPGAVGQRLELSNEETVGNVSLAAIALKGPLPAAEVRRIEVTGPGVRLQGAWQQDQRDGFTSLEDGSQNKGSSRVEIPIDVQKEGQYELSVVWRRPGMVRVRRLQVPQDNARAVPVQVYSFDPPVTANPPLESVPPKGEAHFRVDQTMDTIAYWELEPGFRFGSQDAVEINNLGTRRRVVADSVKFVPLETGSQALLLDDPQAEGGWPKTIPPTQFRPYNQVGAGSVSDNNDKKEMRLLYRPSKAAGWDAGRFYRVNVGFPGFADNETRTPVIVRAEASTPIIQLSRPLRAAGGARVLLDASATYNVQRSPLKFRWVQHGGPRVRFSDPTSAKATFTVEPVTAAQAAWEGLCRALMTHPDFLFTRPRALAHTTNGAERRRLQLVKIAQDLVGRPPTEAEVRKLEAGTPLARMIDGYLESQEFRDFYFHRVRLLLESRGGVVDDEPVRLWCYVVFNDRPFKELLTADYTVDEQLRKQPRPDYHGKTGLLTMKGFIQGKPGLPHFNYAAIVTEKFLGYVYEVPPSIVAMRDSITAVSTTSPGSACYSCHKILTPLAYQRLAWDDQGNYKPADAGKPVNDTDRDLVATYPYRGKGMEAFALQAVNKERFIRTLIQTHFVQLFGREMRHAEDERGLYRRLWDDAARSSYSVKSMLRTLMTSPEYLDGGASAGAKPPAAKPAGSPRRKPTARRRN